MRVLDADGSDSITLKEMDRALKRAAKGNPSRCHDSSGLAELWQFLEATAQRASEFERESADLGGGSADLRFLFKVQTSECKCPVRVVAKVPPLKNTDMANRNAEFKQIGGQRTQGGGNLLRPPGGVLPSLEGGGSSGSNAVPGYTPQKHRGILSEVLRLHEADEIKACKLGPKSAREGRSDIQTVKRPALPMTKQPGAVPPKVKQGSLAPASSKKPLSSDSVERLGAPLPTRLRLIATPSRSRRGLAQPQVEHQLAKVDTEHGVQNPAKPKSVYICWNKGSWNVEVKNAKLGKRFSLDAHIAKGLSRQAAAEAAFQAAKEYKSELISKGQAVEPKGKHASFRSSVAGVRWDKIKKKWKVHIQRKAAGTKKNLYGGYHESKAAAEAKAMEIMEANKLRRNNGKNRLEELPVFAPKAPVPEVKWSAREQRWHAHTRDVNGKVVSKRVKPSNHTEAELERSFSEAAQWVEAKNAELPFEEALRREVAAHLKRYAS